MSSLRREYEYWTKDADGVGYCSTTSFEDAIKGHQRDMQAASSPLGPIEEIYVIIREITTQAKKYSLDEFIARRSNVVEGDAYMLQ